MQGFVKVSHVRGKCASSQKCAKLVAHAPSASVSPVSSFPHALWERIYCCTQAHRVSQGSVCSFEERLFWAALLLHPWLPPLPVGRLCPWGVSARAFSIHPHLPCTSRAEFVLLEGALGRASWSLVGTSPVCVCALCWLLLLGADTGTVRGLVGTSPISSIHSLQKPPSEQAAEIRVILSVVKFLF